ncbi:MAG TPA: MFS transporter, partial [Bacteroidales bacterium]|nr:MFS transporter [Bacteroidales bacterium]
MSALVVKLPCVGFSFTREQLYWLTALTGLAGGTFRIIHTFLLPIVGTRNLITFASLIKIIPLLGIGLAVMNPGTPFWVFVLLSLLLGLGGGDFSSFMPSTSVFFPQRLKGTALGIQAGLTNLGISVVQFITPFIILVPLIGGSQWCVGDKHSAGVGYEIFLQNAAFIYIPFLLIMSWIAWKYLRNVPVKASFREQLDIFSNKHTYICTLLYLITFGTFSGLSAVFPLLIKTLFGNFQDAPDPLTYAFYIPLIGSLTRVFFGFIADRVGGFLLTTIACLGIALTMGGIIGFGLLNPSSLSDFTWFIVAFLIILFFTGVGNAGTFKQFPQIFIANPRQGAGVIGWTAAIAAYGPFIFGSLISISLKNTGSVVPFFMGLALFSLAGAIINFWFYQRKS